MYRVYTERPKRGNARKAWDYFRRTSGKDPEEMFYSQSADFYDTRAPGWTALMGMRIYSDTWGAQAAPIWKVVAPDEIAPTE